MNNNNLVPAQTTQPRSAYKPEIDGLRALAIFAVIVYHFNSNYLPSGFLGVDIFFVISGFVVTYSLSSKPATTWADYLLTFFSNRVKRLYPALVVCVVVTSIIGCLFIPTPKVSLQTGVASLVGFSNLLLFHRSTNYFGQPANLNLFTQTWSLGVEEEFYIIFPVLAGICGFSCRRQQHGHRNLLVIVLGLTVASLIGYIYLSFTHAPAAFFLMPARFWELGAGSLTFLFIQHHKKSLPFFRHSSTQIIVLCLLIGILFMDRNAQVFSTLAAVVLTCIILWFFNDQKIATALCSNHWLVSIGRLSYSLYLWHWSVLVIGRWTIGISLWTLPLYVLLIVSLALLSYHYIEKPFRYIQWSFSKLKTIGYGVTGICLASFLLLGLLGPMDGKLYSGNYDPEFFQASFPLDKSYKTCREPEQISLDFQHCSYPSLDDLAPLYKTLYLVGDSHMASLRALASRFVEEKVVDRVVMVGDSGCLFSPSIDRLQVDGVATNRCPALFRSFLTALTQAGKPGDIVLVASRYKLYFSVPNHPDDVGRRKDDDVFFAVGDLEFSQQQALELYSQELTEISDQLFNQGISLVVQAPLPDWKHYPMHCQTQWFRPSIFVPDTCTLNSEQERNVILPILKSFKVAESESSNLHIYDPFPMFCKTGVCSPFLEDGTLAFLDDDHLNNYGAIYLYEDVLNFFHSQSLL